MDIDAFVRWALDEERTLDQLFTLELLVEDGLQSWRFKYTPRNVWDDYDRRAARDRERKVNPAYRPDFTDKQLRRAAEFLATEKQWHPYSDRPIRDLTPLRFLPELGSVHIQRSEIVDFAPLADLPRLHDFAIGSPGRDFGNPYALDFRPLAQCRGLRTLKLGFNQPWPDLRGLETLPELRELTLGGNLLALPPGVVFPQVRRGALYCHPLAARSVADLPVLPAVEFLTLSGVDRLDGIERHYPRVRNLEIKEDFQDFAPLTVLPDLTCLTVANEYPEDVRPLLRVPRLQRLTFSVQHACFSPRKPRDYSPLADAPLLRDLQVTGCPPVETEVAAIQAGLPGWDDLLFRPEPRPIPPLRFIRAPREKMLREPPHREENLDDPVLPDPGLDQSQSAWLARYLRDAISTALGHRDWGEAGASVSSPQLWVVIHSFDVVDKIPLVLEAIRGVIARLHGDYMSSFEIHLEVQEPEPSPAQKQLDDRFRNAQERAEHEQFQSDRAQYIENLHRFDLQQQTGTPIDPTAFHAAPKIPEPEPEPEEDYENEEEDDEDEPGSGDVAVKKKPNPRPLDPGEHPLADQYRLWSKLNLSEAWFRDEHGDLARYLMGREPDEILLPDPKPEKGGSAPGK